MKKVDVGASIFIFALAVQQASAFDAVRAMAVAGAVLIYYVLARLLVWLMIKAVRHFRRTPQ